MHGIISEDDSTIENYSVVYEKQKKYPSWYGWKTRTEKKACSAIWGTTDWWIGFHWTTMKPRWVGHRPLWEHLYDDCNAEWHYYSSCVGYHSVGRMLVRAMTFCSTTVLVGWLVVIGDWPVKAIMWCRNAILLMGPMYIFWIHKKNCHFVRSSVCLCSFGCVKGGRVSLVWGDLLEDVKLGARFVCSPTISLLEPRRNAHHMKPAT